MNSLLKRTWAEVSLDNIENNYKSIRERLPEGCRFLAVVKADAYGHGAERVAKLMEELGADYFAVATFDEAINLRSWGIGKPLLILGYTPPEYTAELIENGITQGIGSLESAKAYSEAALRLGKRLKAHLKVDSGMGRLGIICHGDRDGESELLEILKLPGLDIEGIFTHFSVSDVHDDEYTMMQFEAFKSLIVRLEEKSGFKFRIRHCTNSGAMINYEETYLDMVRPGLMLYGYYPDRYTGGIELRPAMELKTRVASVKEIEAGDSISYGKTFTAEKPMRVAVMPIGYGDGLHRALSGKIDVLINGKRAPQIGRICMDMCMVDVTDVACAVGDTATVFGRDGGEAISIEEVAEKAGTISYEITCALTQRVPRVYIGGVN